MFLREKIKQEKAVSKVCAQAERGTAEQPPPLPICGVAVPGGWPHGFPSPAPLVLLSPPKPPCAQLCPWCGLWGQRSQGSRGSRGLRC